MTIVLSCARPRPSTEPNFASSPSLHASLAPLTASASGHQAVPSQSLSLALPEQALWHSNIAGSYFYATHPETGSRLWVKRWHQGERVNIQSCQEQSLMWHPDLAAPKLTPVVTSRLRVAMVYHTQVNTHIWNGDETWQGQLTAVGASIRDCLVYVYRTRAPRSPLGRQVVEQRLQVMQQALTSTRVLDVGERPTESSR